MTKIDFDSVKKKIEKKLASAGIANPDVVMVSSGCLIEVIGKKEDGNKIFETLTQLHQKLPKGESAFPYKIYIYQNAEEAFKIDVGFKTKPHDYESGHHTTYLLAQDAIAKMREIDVDALIYGEIRPFTFKVKSRPPQEMFSLEKRIKYRELDVRGEQYDLEAASLKQIDSDYWEITLP